MLSICSVTKDAHNKVNEIVEHCEKTRDHINQSSVEDLLLYIKAKTMAKNLSPDALVCLLNLLVASGPGEHRIRGLDILLDASPHNNEALACMTSIGSSDGSGLEIDAIEAAVRKSLQERTQLEGNNGETLKVIITLLAEILKPAPVLTTESPLDASNLIYKMGDHSINIDLNGKRKRDEIPDSFEDQSMFDFPIDDCPEDNWPSPGLELDKPVVCHRKSQSKSTPKVHMNQKKQRKRLKRVTETGSPLPMIEGPTRLNSKLAKLYSPELGWQENLLDAIDKDKLHDIGEKPQQMTNMIEVPKDIGLDSQTLKNSDHSTSQKAKQFEGSKSPNGCYEIQDFQTHEVQPRISTPARRFSSQESMTVQGDQLVFDQYLDFDGGITVLSKYPENIFSSPERPVPVGDTHLNENLIVDSDVQRSVLPQSNVLPLDSGNGIPQTVTSPVVVADTKPQDLREGRASSACAVILTKHKAVSRLASPSDGHSDGCSASPISTNVANGHQPSPAVYSAAKTVRTPVTARASGKSEPVESSVNQTTTINDDQGRQDANSDTCCNPTGKSVSLLQVQQLVATEVEKAVKGIGAYLCSVSYHDLALAQSSSKKMKATYSIRSKDIAHQDRISRDLGSQIMVSGKPHERCKISKASQLPCSLQRRSPNMAATVDLDGTLQDHAAEFDVPINSSGIAQNVDISSSTIDSNLSSPSTLIAAPSDVSQQILEQVQDLKPDIKPVVLQAITLLINAFRPLNGTRELLNRAAENFSTTLGKGIINQMDTALDQAYQRKLETSLSQLGTSIDELEKLQTSYEHQNDLPLQQFEKHSKPIALIDLAVSSLGKQTVC